MNSDQHRTWRDQLWSDLRSRSSLFPFHHRSEHASGFSSRGKRCSQGSCVCCLPAQSWGRLGAAKAGVIGLTKSLGKELAKTGIAVNCITPTTAKTPILDGLTPEFIEYMRVRIPRDRFVELNEVASMVAWMLSEENSYTTAATFDLSGGRTTY